MSKESCDKSRRLTTAERRVVQAAMRLYRWWPKDVTTADHFSDDTRKMARACAALKKIRGR